MREKNVQGTLLRLLTTAYGTSLTCQDREWTSAFGRRAVVQRTSLSIVGLPDFCGTRDNRTNSYATLQNELWLDGCLLERGADLSWLKSTQPIAIHGSRVGDTLTMYSLQVSMSPGALP